MSKDKSVSRALNDLRQHIAEEEDPRNLRELVIEINALLDMIAAQVSKLEGSQPPLTN